MSEFSTTPIIPENPDWLLGSLSAFDLPPSAVRVAADEAGAIKTRDLTLQVKEDQLETKKNLDTAIRNVAYGVKSGTTSIAEALAEIRSLQNEGHDVLAAIYRAQEETHRGIAAGWASHSAIAAHYRILLHLDPGFAVRVMDQELCHGDRYELGGRSLYDLFIAKSDWYPFPCDRNASHRALICFTKDEFLHFLDQLGASGPDVQSLGTPEQHRKFLKTESIERAAMRAATLIKTAERFGMLPADLRFELKEVQRRHPDAFLDLDALREAVHSLQWLKGCRDAELFDETRSLYRLGYNGDWFRRPLAVEILAGDTQMDPSRFFRDVAVDSALGQKVRQDALRYYTGIEKEGAFFTLKELITSGDPAVLPDALCGLVHAGSEGRAFLKALVRTELLAQQPGGALTNTGVFLFHQSYHLQSATSTDYRPWVVELLAIDRWSEETVAGICRAVDRFKLYPHPCTISTVSHNIGTCTLVLCASQSEFPLVRENSRFLLQHFRRSDPEGYRSMIRSFLEDDTLTGPQYNRFILRKRARELLADALKE